jgi:hypothetical protein
MRAVRLRVAPFRQARDRLSFQCTNHIDILDNSLYYMFQPMDSPFRVAAAITNQGTLHEREKRRGCDGRADRH